MIEFLSGAVTLGYLVAAAFFLSFWRVVIEPASLVYVLRILGFGLIIGAIVDKNVQKPLARTQRRAR